MCKQNNIRYKGKTKFRLKEVLDDKSDKSDEDKDEVDLQKKSVKERKDTCDKKGLSKVWNKAELRKRLESVNTFTPDPDNWQLFEADLRLKSLGD